MSFQRMAATRANQIPWRRKYTSSLFPRSQFLIRKRTTSDQGCETLRQGGETSMRSADFYCATTDKGCKIPNKGCWTWSRYRWSHCSRRRRLNEIERELRDRELPPREVCSHSSPRIGIISASNPKTAMIRSRSEGWKHEMCDRNFLLLAHEISWLLSLEPSAMYKYNGFTRPGGSREFQKFSKTCVKTLKQIFFHD